MTTLPPFPAVMAVIAGKEQTGTGQGLKRFGEDIDGSI
jgi:hypothetical protein